MVDHTPQTSQSITTIRGNTVTATIRVAAAGVGIKNLKQDLYHAYGYIIAHVTGTADSDSPQITVNGTLTGEVYNLGFATSMSTSSANKKENSFDFSGFTSKNFDFIIIMGSNTNKMLCPFL